MASPSECYATAQENEPAQQVLSCGLMLIGLLAEDVDYESDGHVYQLEQLHCTVTQKRLGLSRASASDIGPPFSSCNGEPDRVEFWLSAVTHTRTGPAHCRVPSQSVLCNHSCNVTRLEYGTS